MKREAALIRWRRWATAVKTRPGEKGLKLFVGSAKQMVQVPAGKRLLWALCLSNMWTQYKKGREVGRRGGGPEAVLQPLRAHEDPGSPQQHWPCQRMSVIRRLTEVIPWLSPAMQQASLLSATLKEDREEARERRGGRRRGAQGRWCPFFSQALWELPTIVRKLQLHFSDLLCTPVDSGYWLSGWTWKGYDPHPYPPSLLPFFFFFFVIFGGPPRTREEAGPRFTCSIRLKKGLRGLMRKRKTERGRRLWLWQRRRKTQWAREES